MMALVNTKRLAFLAWAVVNASLVLLIGVELGWGKKLVQPMPVPVVHPSAPVKIVLPPDFRLPALEKAYAGTLERSLFVPTRRKAPPPPTMTPTMQKGQFQLLGTTITDEFSIAIVKEISSGKVRQVYQGFTINGLQLELVEPNRIVFSQYDDREEIRLKIQPSPKPAAAPQGEQPAKPQAVNPAASQRPSQRPVLDNMWSKGQAASTGQIKRPVEVPTRSQAIEAAPQPQTIEDRKADPMLKDFYMK